MDTCPGTIVDLGDFADMESLSLYDQGKVAAEGRRLQRDIDAATDARQRLTQPILELQTKQRRNKEKVYKPRLIALGGNHEYRLARHMENNPALFGQFDVDVSGAKAQGWEYYPFGQIVKIEGVAFCHYFTKPGSNRGWSGKYIAHHLLLNLKESCVQGHTHGFNYHQETTVLGRKLHGLVAGCYFEHEEKYAGRDNQAWWRGITLLHNVCDGNFEIEQVSLAELKRRYAHDQTT